MARWRFATWGHAVFLLCISSVAHAEFRNQLHVFGGDSAAMIAHAKAMGYEYVVGQPWSASVAQQATAAGLKAMFNSTSGEEAKWLRFNNPGGVGSLTPPTMVNGQAITSTLYNELTKSLCLKNAGAPVTDLKRRYHIVSKYEKPEVVLFYNNYRCSSGLNLAVQQNASLYTLHGGASAYDGLFLDQVNPQAVTTYFPTCLNPCLTDPVETVYPTNLAGQQEYTRRMRDYFKNTLGADGVGGNPYNLQKNNGIYPVTLLNLYYNEVATVATNDPAVWGVLPDTAGAVQILPTANANYTEALTALGIAGKYGAWFGWYGGNYPGGVTNAVQLARAVPNWDNLRNATGRAWNATTKIYSSSNSYASPLVIYGRHRQTGKIYVVFQALTGRVVLRPGEVVTVVKRVDGNFTETVDGAADVTVSGGQVSLKSSANLGKGYVLTVQ